MKNWLVSLVIIVSGCSVISATMIPQSVGATAPEDCSQRFLGFPTWFRGLIDPTSTDCSIMSPDGDGLSNFIWHIVLNVIEAAMMAAGYVAVAFILYGGFMYLTSQGEAANVAKAKTTIENALIGLVISLVAVAAVNFIMARLLIS
jgi:hypothetical protein